MRSLTIDPASGRLAPSARAFASLVDPRVAPGDAMYEQGGDEDYLACGASALNVVLSALQLAGAGAPAAVLDFGAGAGRVTRWLRAAFPHAALSACDLRAEDMAFCGERFQAETWVSGTDIAALDAPGRYDLIWVGSVLTHLSAIHSCRLIDKLLGWTNPGGLLILSTIGRGAMARRDQGANAYIHEEGWARITRDYEALGFGYADYQGHDGYGLSLTKLSWLGEVIERLAEARLVILAERAWDDLQDIAALQKTTAGGGSAPPRLSAEAVAAALAARAETHRRNAGIETSRLWRATRPLRSLARLVGQ